MSIKLAAEFNRLIETASQHAEDGVEEVPKELVDAFEKDRKEFHDTLAEIGAIFMVQDVVKRRYPNA